MEEPVWLKWMALALFILFLGIAVNGATDIRINHSVKTFMEVTIAKIENWFGMPARTIERETICSYPTQITSTNMEMPIKKNCKPLSTKTGYGLVDCPETGMTTYYCDGKVTTKEIAQCCKKSATTGECL